jgi:hypothetical protein
MVPEWVIISRRMELVGHGTNMVEKRNTCMSLVGKHQGRGVLGRFRHRCENNVTTDLQEIGWMGVDWIRLVLVNAVMNLQVPSKVRLVEDLLSSEVGLCLWSYLVSHFFWFQPRPNLNNMLSYLPKYKTRIVVYFAI